MSKVFELAAADDNKNQVAVPLMVAVTYADVITDGVPKYDVAEGAKVTPPLSLRKVHKTVEVYDANDVTVEIEVGITPLWIVILPIG